MCLGIPGKVIWIKEGRAGVDFGEVVCEAGTHLVDDLKIGDYVLVHSGYILEKMDLAEAEHTLDLFKQLASSQDQP